MAVRRLDNMGIVVEDLERTISFFQVLGLELEGTAVIEGEWAGRVTGLGHQRVEIAMMRTPDGHARLELSRFLEPAVVADHRTAPVNALGYLRVMFAVDDLDDTLERLRGHGAELVSTEVVQYEDTYRLCYVRGPEGLLLGLAEELGHRSATVQREPSKAQAAVTGAVDPAREQFEAFKALPRDEPVHMLNLVRYREQAAYPDGTARSGREAYAEYGRTSGAVFRRVGGRIVWSGQPQAVVIGPADEQWDLAFVAEYPTASAFLEMVTDPEYREAVKHRQAAVEDSRLVRMRPQPAGEGFGL